MSVEEQGLHPKQIEAFRRMTPARKLEIAGQLWLETRALKAAALRAKHQDWTEAQILEELREIFLHATT